MKGIIIQGSSRSRGNTYKVVRFLQEQTGFDVVDLLEKNIGHYDYDNKNQGDDFLPLMRNLVNNYELIIFATPVYWYSMSGILKDFFDRITDCLDFEKETGRKLRGKKMAMISCSNDDDLNKHFNMPFSESADYLGMTYMGDAHIWVKKGKIVEAAKERLVAFVEKINKSDL